jgi:hypothetical protein
VCWHIDDLLIHLIYSNVVTLSLDWLAHCYYTADKKMNVTRGPHHNYLGMNIDFSTTGAAKFDMVPYITKIINAFPERITAVSSATTTDHLFAICPPNQARSLPEDQARAYHHTTA